MNDQLSTAIKHIIRGCGYIPRRGYHPGTKIFLFLTMMAGVIGLRGGVFRGLGGALVMLIIISPFYLYGAYRRSIDENKHY